MSERRSSSSALEDLANVMKRTTSDRNKVALMLQQFKKQHEELYAAFNAERSKNKDLEKKNKDLTTQCQSLTQKNAALEQEVSTLAAAIEVANREMLDADSMLLDAASSVRSSMSSAPSPQIKEKARIEDKVAGGNADREEAKNTNPQARIMPTIVASNVSDEGKKAAPPSLKAAASDDTDKKDDAVVMDELTLAMEEMSLTLDDTDLAKVG